MERATVDTAITANDLVSVSLPKPAKFPVRCRMCNEDIGFDDDLVFVKRTGRLPEQRHGGCLTDEEKALQGDPVCRRDRLALHTELHTVHLTGSQLEVILSGLSGGPEDAAIRSACEEALDEIRDRLTRRRS